MSWEASLQDASFRGVGFDVINTRDSTSRVTAVYEYPYIDGGDIEDLGRKPRNLIMTTLFWGMTMKPACSRSLRRSISAVTRS